MSLSIMSLDLIKAFSLSSTSSSKINSFYIVRLTVKRFDLELFVNSILGIIEFIYRLNMR